MSSSSILIASLALLAIGGGGLIAWTRFGPGAAPPPPESELAAPDKARRIAELAAVIALEAIRFKNAVSADEIETIERMLTTREAALGRSPSAVVNEILKTPEDKHAAPAAVDEVLALTDDRDERKWVLSVLAAVIFSDDLVEPDEAYFFYKAADRMGWAQDTAEREFGIQTMVTEEYQAAKHKLQDEGFYDNEPGGSDGAA